jgi:hypothetical protein
MGNEEQRDPREKPSENRLDASTAQNELAQTHLTKMGKNIFFVDPALFYTNNMNKFRVICPSCWP